MNKLFKKYLVSFTVLSVLIFFLVIVSEHLFEQYLVEKGMTKLTSRTYQLLDQTLPDDITAAKAQLEKYQEGSKNPLQIMPIDKLHLDAEETEQLEQQGYLRDATSNASTLDVYYRWRNSTSALHFRLPYSKLNTMVSYIDPIFLLNKGMIKSSQTLTKDLQRLSDSYHFDYQMVKLSDLQLTSRDLSHLESNHWLNQYLQKTLYDKEILFLSFSQTEVLQIGPLSWPFNDQAHDLMMFFTLLVLLWIAAILFSYKLYQSIQVVVKTAQACANGETPKTGQLSKTSFLYDIEQALISMATALQGMIRNQHVLIQSISHDIKTPLMRLKFQLHGLQTDQETKKDLQEDIHDIEDLVESIRIYADTSKSIPSLNLTEVEVNTWIRDSLRSQTIPAHLNLKIAAHGRISTELDLFLMNRVLQNLLENACHYAESYIKITTTIETAELSIAIENDIKDQQAHHQSWGMGLVIVENIVQWHQGTVVIDRQPNLFKVTCQLPLAHIANANEGQLAGD